MRTAVIAIVVWSSALGCAGGGGPPVDGAAVEAAEAELAEQDAAEDAEDEAEAPEEPEGPPVDGTSEQRGHEDGPIRKTRTLFFGMVGTDETRYLTDGRVLVAFVNRTRGRTFKVGDAAFTDGRWWFGPDNLLRQHTLWAAGMSSATCASALAKMTEDYGPPTKAEGAQAVWVGEVIMARWTDATAADVAPRCEVEWIDLPFFRR